MKTQRQGGSTGWGLVVLGGILFAIYASGGSGEKTATESKPAPPKVSDEECRKDLNCWAERHIVSATVRCRRRIEALAKFQSEWTDSWYEQKFSHFRWASQAAGTITFIGDKIKFQNGFGAWQPYTYTCDFQPAGETVLKVDAFAGRIPER